MREIDINDYDYDLPDDRIAQYPVNERDKSKLLVYKDDSISEDIFTNIDEYLPPDSLLVFNNTRVIRARILFQKETGANVEILCLEPISPVDYSLSFSSKKPVEWKCIVGNLKKWKGGILTTPFKYKGNKHNLSSERLQPLGEAWCIRFRWTCKEISFGEALEKTGHIPLPPYIDREDEAQDIERYNTIYSKIKGSVAAPTAGLHFTENVFEKIKARGIKTVELTLHVGAGTFKPIKSRNIYEHEMHCEHFSTDARTIQLVLENQGKVIPVGTTSVRTLESLYWLGVKLIQNPSGSFPDFSLGQWEAYEMETNVSVKESLGALLNYIHERNLICLQASTSIMIVPGYQFRMTNGMITNFHQPRSTLLLLISAWAGSRWKKIYTFALENRFRFLSYGDSSLLLK
ncbi:MAG: S-adenosylmethionine:tRNA ribosyltransferase-isomerase [Bacteroidales bacterium]|jgi:S-adenosylmethionine:tRNA ribosyltransferase-isomerase